MDISESLVNIPAAVFKAECLKLMDQVAKTRVPVVITKHGRPVAQLAPVPVEARSLFGYMKDTVRIEGDVTGPVDLTTKRRQSAKHRDHLHGAPTQE